MGLQGQDLSVSLRAGWRGVARFNPQLSAESGLLLFSGALEPRTTNWNRTPRGRAGRRAPGGPPPPPLPPVLVTWWNWELTDVRGETQCSVTPEGLGRPCLTTGSGQCGPQIPK